MTILLICTLPTLGMDDAATARNLISGGRYREAITVLDRLLSIDQEKDENWYLRGVASLKLKNYESAKDHIMHAIALKDKGEYRRMKGLAHFEVYELNEAVEEFSKAIALDPADNEARFFLAFSYILMDDPRGTDHLREAARRDAKSVKTLLKQTYALAIEKNPKLSQGEKKRIMELIAKLGG